MASPPIERQINNALELLREGVRPTVQALLQKGGGSATTATEALQQLFQVRLPEILRGEEVAHPVVDTEFERAFRSTWSLALDAANKQADQRLQDDKNALAVERANMAVRLQRLEDETQEHLAARLEAEAEARRALDEIARLKNQAEGLRGELHTARDAALAVQTSLAALREDHRAVCEKRDSLEAAVSDAQQHLKQATIAHEGAMLALGQQHANAIAALKDHYVERDQRQLVEIDALRTQLTAVHAKLEDARQRTAAAETTHAAERGRLTAELQAATRLVESHEAALAKAQRDIAECGERLASKDSELQQLTARLALAEAALAAAREGAGSKPPSKASKRGSKAR